MTDLNVMMREHALSGLNTKLDAAVTNGDTEAARKVSLEIATLTAASAPKAPPFTSGDVWKAAEGKAPWLGVDPKKSATANQFAQTMNLAKFGSADAMADAIIKAVEEEYKTAPAEGEEIEEPGEEEDGEPKPEKKARKTDGPRENDTPSSASRRAVSSAPWAKMSDAPADVQREINRSADKFVSATAPKENREKFVKNALASHHAIYLRNKGKK